MSLPPAPPGASPASLAPLVDAWEAGQASRFAPGALVVLDYTEAPPGLQRAARVVSQARDPRRREAAVRSARQLRAKAKAHESLARTLDAKGQSVSAAQLRALARSKIAQADELEAFLLP